MPEPVPHDDVLRPLPVTRRGYLVGERGPELFVPTSAGRVESAQSGKARDVRISITVGSSSPAAAPQALQRSSRQIASAVRRALAAN